MLDVPDSAYHREPSMGAQASATTRGDTPNEVSGQTGQLLVKRLPGSLCHHICVRTLSPPDRSACLGTFRSAFRPQPALACAEAGQLQAKPANTVCTSHSNAGMAEDGTLLEYGAARQSSASPADNSVSGQCSVASQHDMFSVGTAGGMTCCCQADQPTSASCPSFFSLLVFCRPDPMH